MSNVIDNDERPPRGNKRETVLDLIEQPCRACGELYRVKRQHAHWRDLCTVCYRANKTVPLRCTECRRDLERDEAIGGLCLECYSAETLRVIQDKSRRQPTLPPTLPATFQPQPKLDERPRLETPARRPSPRPRLSEPIDPFTWMDAIAMEEGIRRLTKASATAARPRLRQSKETTK